MIRTKGSKTMVSFFVLMGCLTLLTPAVASIGPDQITITVTRTVMEYEAVTTTRTTLRTSTYKSTIMQPVTTTETQKVTVTPTVTITEDLRLTAVIYQPCTSTTIMSSRTTTYTTTSAVTTRISTRTASTPNEHDLREYAEYRTKTYEALYDAWMDPIRMELLKPIIDGLYSDIVRSAILDFMPSTNAPLLKNPQEILDSIDTLHQSYELIADEPPSEKQFRHDIEMDYYGLGIGYLTADGINIGQMPMQYDNTFWLMRESCYKERIYRVGPWDWWKYWEAGDYLNNFFSGGELLRDLVSSEKAFISTLQKVLGFMIEARGRASTDYYKTLVDLTIDFLQADIAYLNSL